VFLIDNFPKFLKNRNVDAPGTVLIKPYENQGLKFKFWILKIQFLLILLFGYV